MPDHEKINYLEIPSRDLAGTKRFFQSVFDWTFQDYGPDYCAFNGAGIDGGFFRSEKPASTKNGSVLIVFYSDSLESTRTKVVSAGGKIIKPVFSFPGGFRFHFSEPGGSEFAAWSETDA